MWWLKGIQTKQKIMFGDLDFINVLNAFDAKMPTELFVSN